MEPQIDRTRIIHAIGDGCINHCFWHNIDEHVDGTCFQWCFECGHVYGTKRDMLREWRRGLKECSRRSDPWFFSNQFAESKLRSWWRRLIIRADQVGFCPMCSHDW